MTDKNRQAKKKQKKGLLIFLLCLLLLSGSYAVYLFFWDRPKESVPVISGDFLPKGKDAQKMSDKELAAFAQKAVDASQFNMMIGAKAEIDSRTQKGTLHIRNPQTNAYPVNVVVNDDQTGEVIYTSGAIRPGEEVMRVKLEKKLSKGTYQTTAHFSLYHPTSKAKMGDVAAGVSFIVN